MTTWVAATSGHGFHLQSVVTDTYLYSGVDLYTQSHLYTVTIDGTLLIPQRGFLGKIQ